MTATDELRRILDERGIEYETDDAQVSETEWYYVTKLRDGYRDRWTYEEPPDCDLLVSYQYDLGAEDAIAATIGDTDATPTRQGDADLAADNARLRVFASCAYGIASKFMRLNGCPYYDNEMECSLSDECEGTACAEQPDCLLDALAKALGIEVEA